MFRYSYMLRRPIAWAAVISMMMIFSSCSKNGKKDEIPEFTRVSMRLNTTKLAPVLYKIEIENNLFKDSVVPGDRQTRLIEYKDSPQRLIITEKYSNDVLLDTMIDIPKSYEALYTIYQLDTTENAKPLFIFLDPSKPNELPSDKFAQGVYYNDPIFPDTIDVYVYKVIDYSTLELPAAHVYNNLKRGEFSEFALLEVSGLYVYEFRNKNGEAVHGTQLADPANALSGGFLENRCLNDVSNHQVTKLSYMNFGDFDLTYIECMFMY
jgi:hypothetical protein